MLYRKYRPQTFSDVVGQDDIVRTLRGALATDRVGHAYLFSGPRGTGKTTLARIMARAVNCAGRTKDQDPCNRCESCVAMSESRSLDLIEIDAASNRGIDDVRALKESASTASAGGAHKIFIIDEVHGLTKDAFNALLKVLEEPPAHVMFLLATTEAHKIIPTVLSRLQRLNVMRLKPEQIAGKLKLIARKEKASIPDEALMAIARAGDGALRDAEVMLSKVIGDQSAGASVEDIYALLGLVPSAWNEKLFGLLHSRERTEALAHLRRIEESGADAEHFTKGFLEHLRVLLMTKLNKEASSREVDGTYLVQAIKTFTRSRTQLRGAPIPYLPLELAVIELTEPVEQA